MDLSIGQLAADSGCTVPTIRFYEQEGLLRTAARSASGHRRYRASDLQRLVFIRRCRDFGFPLEQVRQLVALVENGDRSCTEVRDHAQVRLDEVRRKLAEMHALEQSLQAFVTSCNSACCAGPARDCVIIDDLSRITELKRKPHA